MCFNKCSIGQQMGRRLSSDHQAVLPMQDFFAAIAQGLRVAQESLDERGRESIVTWEQEGLPPTVWTWADCSLHFPVAFRLLPKATLADATQLAVAPRKDAQIRLKLTVRYLLTPQAEEP